MLFKHFKNTVSFTLTHTLEEVIMNYLKISEVYVMVRFALTLCFWQKIYIPAHQSATGLHRKCYRQLLALHFWLKRITLIFSNNLKMSHGRQSETAQTVPSELNFISPIQGRSNGYLQQTLSIQTSNNLISHFNKFLQGCWHLVLCSWEIWWNVTLTSRVICRTFLIYKVFKLFQTLNICC